MRQSYRSAFCRQRCFKRNKHAKTKGATLPEVPFKLPLQNKGKDPKETVGFL